MVNKDQPVGPQVVASLFFIFYDRPGGLTAHSLGNKNSRE